MKIIMELGNSRIVWGRYADSPYCIPRPARGFWVVFDSGGASFLGPRRSDITEFLRSISE